MRFSVVFLFAFFSVCLYSQKVDDDNTVYTVVSNMPIFDKACLDLSKEDQHKCSRDAWFEYLKTVKTPKGTLKNGEKSKFFMSFIVERDGTISTINILRSSGNKKLDKAAIKHLKKMPKFYKPGYQKGVSVRVKYNFPINFKG